jgi:hypothetical protein
MPVRKASPLELDRGLACFYGDIQLGLLFLVKCELVYITIESLVYGGECSMNLNGSESKDAEVY